MVEYEKGMDKQYRITSTIKTPPFKAPIIETAFKRGNSMCKCSCQAKLLPRNALLIRPNIPNEKASENMFNLMIFAWKIGELQRLGNGSCQTFLKVSNVKEVFGNALKDNDLGILLRKAFSVKCIDNKDNSKLKKGDVILDRVGSKRSVGKPHLILGEI